MPASNNLPSGLNTSPLSDEQSNSGNSNFWNAGAAAPPTVHITTTNRGSGSGLLGGGVQRSFALVDDGEDMDSTFDTSGLSGLNFGSLGSGGSLGGGDLSGFGGAALGGAGLGVAGLGDGLGLGLGLGLGGEGVGVDGAFANTLGGGLDKSNNNNNNNGANNAAGGASLSAWQ